MGSATDERATASVFLLAVQRGLSRAHWPEPERPELRDLAGTPGPRRRRTAPARLRSGESAADGAHAAARRARDPPVAGDPGVPGRGLAFAAPVADDRPRPRPRTQPGAAGGLRHPSAQQPARPTLFRTHLAGAAIRARRLGQALDRGRL